MPPTTVPHPEPVEGRTGGIAAPAVSALEGAGAAAGDGARPRRAERLGRALALSTQLPAGLLGALLVERAGLAQLAAALAIIATVAAALWLARPALAAMGAYNLVVFFVALVALCVVIGVPIAFAFGVATLSYLALMTRVPLIVAMGRMDEGMSHLILLAVPLFVFLGVLIEMTGLARAMVDFLASLLGHVRGGLSYVLLGAMYLVSGISGSKAADMAAVAPVLFPEMKKRGAAPAAR